MVISFPIIDRTYVNLLLKSLTLYFHLLLGYTVLLVKGLLDTHINNKENIDVTIIATAISRRYTEGRNISYRDVTFPTFLGFPTF